MSRNVFFILVLSCSPMLNAQLPTPPSPLSIADSVQTVSGSVVLVRTEAETGTGFYATTHGEVVTALHVVSLPDKSLAKNITVEVYVAERKVGRNVIQGFVTTEHATVLVQDTDHDLAILQPEGLAFMRGAVTFSDSDLLDMHPAFLCSRETVLRDGDPVFTVGHPLGDTRLVTTHGIIASADKVKRPGSEVLEGSYLVDMLINHGNSGGPVFYPAGNCVVGVADSIGLRALEGIDPNGAGIQVQPTIDVIGSDGKPMKVKLAESTGLGTLIPQQYIIQLLDKTGHTSSRTVTSDTKPKKPKRGSIAKFH